ncbi:MAG: TetR/AcrR family transcriptional regulator [Cyclobacteriaceae bacterium]|nr:TetR/AcrR family transcriptional regulator [Cyclobacteriaceae bacterium]
MLETRRFEEVKVMEICKEAAISKVTFFKYFVCKEELLRYSFRVWCFLLTIELKKNPIRGLEGVYFIFDRVSTDLQKRPSFFYALIAYQMNDERLQSPFPINKEERKNFISEKDYTEIPEIQSLQQMIENFVLEAVFDKELNYSNPAEICETLLILLYGNIVRMGMTKQFTPKFKSKQIVDRVLKTYK